MQSQAPRQFCLRSCKHFRIGAWERLLVSCSRLRIASARSWKLWRPNPVGALKRPMAATSREFVFGAVISSGVLSAGRSRVTQDDTWLNRPNGSSSRDQGHEAAADVRLGNTGHRLNLVSTRNRCGRGIASGEHTATGCDQAITIFDHCRETRQLLAV